MTLYSSLSNLTRRRTTTDRSVNRSQRLQPAGTILYYCNGKVAADETEERQTLPRGLLVAGLLYLYAVYSNLVHMGEEGTDPVILVKANFRRCFLN